MIINMKPVVSVCIPVYNVERYIHSCIMSVLEQTFQDFEIIVVNDSTQDASMQIVESMAINDPRIKIYHNHENLGLMSTRREGYIHASGEYVFFLDSDDTLPKNALGDLYHAITKWNCDVVCGQIAYITSNGISLDKYPNTLKYGNDSKAAMKSALRWEITHNLCGKIFKRELLQSYHYNTFEHVVNAEDAILFYQILTKIESIYTIPNVVYNYYLYDGSSTNVELGSKALKGIFIWQKERYDIINNEYPSLLEDLYISMISYLTGLTPSLNSRKLINEYLHKYQVPFHVNLRNIVEYTPLKKIPKSIMSYYLSGIVKIIRNYRLRHGNYS